MTGGADVIAARQSESGQAFLRRDYQKLRQPTSSTIESALLFSIGSLALFTFFQTARAQTSTEHFAIQFHAIETSH